MAATANGHAPAEFPPPVDPLTEFIAAPEAGEDEAIEVGVAIVGGGPAGLAAANRLLQLLADDEELLEQLGEVPVAVIEKGKSCGGHNLSGAVMKPGPLRSLFPDEDLEEWPEDRIWAELHLRMTDEAGFSLTEGSTEGATGLEATFAVTTYLVPPDQGLTAGATATSPTATPTETAAPTTTGTPSSYSTESAR